MDTVPLPSLAAAPQGQRLAQGGFWQCMQRLGMFTSRPSTTARWMKSQL